MCSAPAATTRSWPSSPNNDSHVAQLLDEAVYHIEHVRLGARDDTA
jgi:hypothetical protein